MHNEVRRLSHHLSTFSRRSRNMLAKSALNDPKTFTKTRLTSLKCQLYTQKWDTPGGPIRRLCAKKNACYPLSAEDQRT
jgi:hypothetical protein